VRVASGQIHEIAIDGGELYLRRGDNLLAQSFDETAAAVSGQVRTVASGVVAFAGAGGTLAYYARPHGLLQNQKVRWFGRDGTVLADTAEGGTYRDVRVSPDGQSLAVLRTNARGLGEIWTYDLNRQIDAPAISGVSSFNPVWLPDGRALVAGTGRGLVRARIGDPTPQPLFASDPAAAVPEDISPDGKHLLYVPIETGSARLMVRSLEDGSPARQVGPATTRLGATGVFSPDGRWILYSIYDGTAPRLYATPFPALDSRTPVTAVTGIRPRWRRDGRELFFVTSQRGPTTNEERRLMSVPVSWTPNGPEFGRAQPLFAMKGLAVAGVGAFDVSTDAQRFVFVVDSDRDRSPIVVRVRR
jgi:Tol biopolymer transport system component